MQDLWEAYMYIDNEPEDDLSEAETVLINQFDDLF